jgi:hypothetical protein
MQKGIVAVPTRLLFNKFCFCSTNHSTVLSDASRCWFESFQLPKFKNRTHSSGERHKRVEDETALPQELDKRDAEFDNQQSPLSSLWLHHHPTPISHPHQKSF